MRADAAREETEESLGIMESRLDRAEHNIQLLQHAVHQHDERIAGFMYSPARNSVAVRALVIIPANPPFFGPWSGTCW